MNTVKFYIYCLGIFALLCLIAIIPVSYYGDKSKTFNSNKFEDYLKSFTGKKCLNNTVITNSVVNEDCIDYNDLTSNNKCYYFVLSLKYEGYSWSTSIPILKCYNITTDNFVYNGLGGAGSSMLYTLVLIMCTLFCCGISILLFVYVRFWKALEYK